MNKLINNIILKIIKNGSKSFLTNTTNNDDNKYLLSVCPETGSVLSTSHILTD